MVEIRLALAVATEWIKTTVGEQATLQRGIDITKAEQRIGSIPVVSSGGVSSYHDVAQVHGPGVILGRKGVVGSVYYVEQDYWPHDTTLWVKDFHGNEPRFVYYFFREMASRLAAMDVGSANPTLNRNHVHPTPISWPPLSEQRAIASVLGTLDDKIELNRRMNETLEETARALFKSWFVDFDPVRAKMEGRQPAGMDDETAALFPDSFEDSALGEIPKGWGVGCLGDIADNVRRGVNPSDISEFTPYIGLDHMPRKSIALSEWGQAGQVGSNKSAFRQGEILFGKLRPYFHKVGVAPVDGVCSTDILVVKPRRPSWYGLALSHLSSVALVNHADATSSGTKMPRAKWADLTLFPITIPPEGVGENFTEKVRPLVEHIHSNVHLSRTLAAIRDALLPKLLSGEVRVGEAEEIVEETV